MFDLEMEFNIKEEYVEEFNKSLREKGSIIRLRSKENIVYIELMKDDYLNMENQIIHPTKKFYEDMESFFKEKGIEITYNNTGSCFWKI